MSMQPFSKEADRRTLLGFCRVEEMRKYLPHEKIDKIVSTARQIEQKAFGEANGDVATYVTKLSRKLQVLRSTVNLGSFNILCSLMGQLVTIHICGTGSRVI
jgi:hypothetical protein